MRPGFLVASVIIGALGYLAVATTWPDVRRLKGPQWFGEETRATVVDANVFLDNYWTKDRDLIFYDEIRAKYQFEVDGTIYEYPYNDGYCRVPLVDASADFITVKYLPSDPTRNHPTTMRWVAENDIFGWAIGVCLLQLALLFLSLSLRELIVGPDN
jgi:hypothetical protein